MSVVPHIREAMLDRHFPLREFAAAASLLAASIVATFSWAHLAATSAVTSESGLVPSADWATFGMIVIRNAGVALGLFSGAVTLGISTAIFTLMVGAMLGWSMAVSVAALGVAETIARSWAYTPLELAGFTLAAAAGLIPLFGLARRGHTSPGAHRGHDLARSLRVLMVAIGFLILAAVVETVSIHLTGERIAAG